MSFLFRAEYFKYENRSCDILPFAGVHRFAPARTDPNEYSLRCEFDVLLTDDVWAPTATAFMYMQPSASLSAQQKSNVPTEFHATARHSSIHDYGTGRGRRTRWKSCASRQHRFPIANRACLQSICESSDGDKSWSMLSTETGALRESQ